MRKITYLLLLVAGFSLFMACSDDVTYADQVKRERSAISAYLVSDTINVISEDQFHAQGDSTDVNKNQYVLFESSGLYMQIIRKGSGEPLRTGETARVLCRFTETNLLTDSIQLSNTIAPYYYRWVEAMTVTNNSGTFQGSFDSNSSLMSTIYGSTTIPSGWLAVLPYVNLGRWSDKDSEIAKVKIIVPHDLGQTYAMQSVYPCLYELTFQKGI